MSKIEDFKSFVRENPKLINYVKNNKKTWQNFYELYDIYGNDNEVWNEYLKDKPEETNSTKKNSSTLNEIINMAKNMDVDKVQEGITSIQKAIALFSDLFIKGETNTQESGYTPRPIYRSFED